MKITLWGDHARDFSINNIYDNETGNLIVCLVVGCTPREDIKNNGNSSFTIPLTSANCIYVDRNQGNILLYTRNNTALSFCR